MARLKSHTQATLLVHQSGCPPLPRQGVSDGIVQSHQPDVASVWELLLIQYKRQGAVCQPHFQLFPVKAKPCHRSTVVRPSLSVHPMPTSTSIGTDWSRFSCMVCLTACRALRFMPSRIAPTDWGVEFLEIISCPFKSEKNIPSKETAGTQLRPCPARWLHR